MRAFVYSRAPSLLLAVLAMSTFAAHCPAEDSPPAKADVTLTSKDGEEKPDNFNSVRQRLARPISVTLKGVPLKEAFMEIVVQAKVDIVISRIDEKMFEHPVHLLLNQCPADVILRQMLFQLDPDLDFAIRDGFVLVAHRDRLDAIYETRVYPGSVLPSLTAGLPVGSFPNDQPAEKLRQLLSVVEPLSWEQNGGIGRMALANNSLVVWQSPRVHEQIADLFDELQQADAHDRRSIEELALPSIAPASSPAGPALPLPAAPSTLESKND